ncbi:hypothetical protein [Halomicronema hongdechloris]|nr:hypothetical protein [Halomicronema hongdechloris]
MPFAIVLLVMCYSLYRGLHEEHLLLTEEGPEAMAAAPRRETSNR